MVLNRSNLQVRIHHRLPPPPQLDFWGDLSKIAGVSSPAIAELVARTLGDGATFVVSGVAAIMGLAATLACPETLPKSERKPFEVKRANPVSGVWVLLSHGRRLRQLTLATAINRFAVNINLVLLESYRLGALGWVPLDMSRYKQSVAWLHGLFQGVMIPKILRRYGNRRAGEIATVVLGFGIIAWGNTYRLFTNHKFGVTPFMVAYTLVQLASHNTWDSVSKFSLQASVVEEGMRVTDSGKGELNAAYEGLELLVKVVMPPLAGRLFAEFQRPTVLPSFLRWGGGGTYIVGGLLCLSSAAVLITTPSPRAAGQAVKGEPGD